MKEQEFYNDFNKKLKEQLDESFVDSLLELMQNGKLSNQVYLELIDKEIGDKYE